MSAEEKETRGKEFGAQTESTLVGGGSGRGASVSKEEIIMDRNSDRVRRSLFRAVDQVVLRVARRATLFGFAEDEVWGPRWGAETKNMVENFPTGATMQATTPVVNQ